MSTPDPTTAEGRQELRRIEAAATTGPWERNIDARYPIWATERHQKIAFVISEGRYGGKLPADEVAANLALIPAARNALIAALDHIDAQAARIEELEAEVRELRAWRIRPEYPLSSADMWWDDDDPERSLEEPDELAKDAGPYEVVSLLRGASLPTVHAFYDREAGVCRFFAAKKEAAAAAAQAEEEADDH